MTFINMVLLVEVLLVGLLLLRGTHHVIKVFDPMEVGD